VILLPGWWLGAWAWDEVVRHLSDLGVAAHPLTLPGLEPAPHDGIVLTDHVGALASAHPVTPGLESSAPLDGIVLADHVGALVAAVRSAEVPVVLVAHSGAGAVVTGALDTVGDLVARVVYVDSGPSADGSVASPDLSPETVEVPLPPFADLEAVGVSTADLTPQMLQRFRDRAVPHPAGPLREPLRLTNPARNQVPATVVCCSFPSAAVREMAAAGTGMFAPLSDLTDATYVDLPTGHWPMWSRPDALADLIAEAAAV